MTHCSFVIVGLRVHRSSDGRSYLTLRSYRSSIAVVAVHLPLICRQKGISANERTDAEMMMIKLCKTLQERDLTCDPSDRLAAYFGYSDCGDTVWRSIARPYPSLEAIWAVDDIPPPPLDVEMLTLADALALAEHDTEVVAKKLADQSISKTLHRQAYSGTLGSRTRSSEGDVTQSTRWSRSSSLRWRSHRRKDVRRLDASPRGR